ERRTVNPYVTGSSPVGGARFRKARAITVRAFCFLPFLFQFSFILILINNHEKYRQSQSSIIPFIRLSVLEMHNMSFIYALK
uniref:hypothetical protein n=1 Tax=Proteus sp. FME41 TaxID=2742608 RepID=UPI001D02E0EC